MTGGDLVVFEFTATASRNRLYTIYTCLKTPANSNSNDQKIDKGSMYRSNLEFYAAQYTSG